MPRGEATLDSVRFSVLAVDHLESYPEAEKARALLDQAVDVINVLLKRRRWTIVRVSEFFPRSDNLLGLNVNHGEHVKVRIRRPCKGGRVAARSMYAFEEVMCTLIHETVHNTVSPHNASFWKLYHELVAECEGIIAERSRATGASAPVAPKPQEETSKPMVPFAGVGRRLGGAAPAPNTPMSRMCAAAAARRLSVIATARGDAGCCGSQRERAPSAAVGAPAQPEAERPEGTSGHWICDVCQRRNHELLPYCEWCCSDGGDADDAELQAAVAASLQVTHSSRPEAVAAPAPPPLREPNRKVHRVESYTAASDRDIDVVDLTDE